MSTEEAFQIVYDLAQSNALNPDTDYDMHDEAMRQKEALATVHDYLLKHVYD